MESSIRGIVSKRAILSSLVVLFMLFSGFAILPAHTAEADAAAAARTLNIAMQQDMPNFNTFDLSSNSVWKANVIGFNFEGLAGIDSDLTPFPLLAQSWTVDANTLTVVAKVRQGVTFQDGSPMTADDVIFSYYTERALTTTVSSFLVNAFGTGGTITFDQIKAGVQKIDDTTIQFKMLRAFSGFFTQTLTIPVIPKAIWGSHTIDEQSGAALDYLAGGVVDVKWNIDPAATTGTGPVMYAGGIPRAFRIEKVYQNYWGKNVKTPQGYPLFFSNFDTIRFTIYTSLDTAILALQGGDVDHLPWALTPGQIPVLAANPNVKLTFTKDNGYFYLAFNEKRRPMNYLSFRRAVSYLIDKATVVERYMGGFGQPGDANEPPFWGDGWYNSSVTRYPFDPTFTATRNELLAGGFTYDQAANSWTMPNGQALPPLTILTPPATYDPIRVRVGQAVAQNLNSIGIRATAQAIDFDLLVARMSSFTYDMLTLGWLLSNDPVDNVFFDFGPKDTQNYYGFWSDANPNPAYAGVGEVSTLADAQTQAYADQVQKLEDTARTTFDVPTQQKYTKWAQGIFTLAVPINVLYYRTNAFAARSSWTGWTPFLGQLWNTFSLASLSRQAAPPLGAVINGRVIVPPAVLQGRSVTGVVVAQDGNGFPTAGVDVSVTTTGKTSASPASGKTDPNGEFRFDLTGVAGGFDYVNATLTVGSTKATASANLEVKAPIPYTLLLTATPGTKILAVGGSTDIALKVVDQARNPVSGASVSVDTRIIGKGTVLPASGQVTTDASGSATMTYVAPATADVNSHSPANLVFTATSGILTSNNAQVSLLTYNGNPSLWRFVSVTSVSIFVLNPTTTTSHVALLATDQSGTPLPSETFAVSYSNPDLLVTPKTQLTTATDGTVAFDIVFKANAPSSGLRVSFRNDAVLNSVSDGITLLFNNPASPLPTGTYAGLIKFSNPRITAAFGSLDITITIVAQDGMIPATATAAVALGATLSGQLMDLKGDTAKGFALTYNVLGDFAGLLIKTTVDAASLSTGGVVAANIDPNIDWSPAIDGYGAGIGDVMKQANYFDNLHSVNLTAGTVTLTMVGTGSGLADLANDIFVVPGGQLSYDINTVINSGYSTLNYILEGKTVLTTQYVVKRNPKILTIKEGLDRMYMRTNPAYGPNTISVSATAVDQDGNPVSGATLRTYQRITAGGSYRGDDGARPPTLLYICPGCRGGPAAPKTDASGTATATLTAAPITVPVKANLYMRATKSGYLDLFDVTNIYIYPVQTVITLTPDAYTMPVSDTPYRHVAMQGSMSVTAKIVDEKGDPLVFTPLELFASQGAVVAIVPVLIPNLGFTDVNGEVKYTVSLSTTDPATNTVDLTGGLTAPGFVGARAQLSVVKYVPPSTIVLTAPGQGASVVQADKITIAGFVQNANGVGKVRVRVDGAASDYTQVQSWTTASGTAPPAGVGVRFDAASLSVGSHTVYVEATDAYGVVTTHTETFTVTAKPTLAPSVFSSDAAATLGLLAIVLAAIALIVSVARGRSRRAMMGPPGGGEERAQAPEEMPRER